MYTHIGHQEKRIASIFSRRKDKQPKVVAREESLQIYFLYFCYQTQTADSNNARK